MSIHFGEWEIDSGRRELLRAGEPVALTPKAFHLLELLIEERPRVVSKAQIYERLWPSTFVSEGNLSRLVFELRAALQDDPQKPRWLRTARGFGYAFCGMATEDVGRRAQAIRQGACWLILGDREIALAEGENVLGRSREASVPIASASVSRRHARIVVAGAHASLEDLGSKNGTRWCGEEVRAPIPLADGDSIRVGTVEMTFRVVTPEESTATGIN